MVVLQFNLIMGGLLKLLLLFGVFFIGYRMFTKPFRQYVKAKKKHERFKTKSEKSSKNKPDKTDNIGDYIDYEEVE